MQTDTDCVVESELLGILVNVFLVRRVPGMVVTFYTQIRTQVYTQLCLQPNYFHFAGC